MRLIVASSALRHVLGHVVQRYRNKISAGGGRRGRGHSGANDKRFPRENGIVEELY